MKKSFVSILAIASVLALSAPAMAFSTLADVTFKGSVNGTVNTNNNTLAGAQSNGNANVFGGNAGNSVSVEANGGAPAIPAINATGAKFKAFGVAGPDSKVVGNVSASNNNVTGAQAGIGGAVGGIISTNSFTFTYND